MYFTGSKAHNIALRSIAIKQGLKLSEYGIFRDEKRLAARTEKEVYAIVGLDYIAPELREDRGEIDAARNHTLPDLVTMDDLISDPRSLLASDAVATIDHTPGAISATDRVLAAIKNPKTLLVSHATGRESGVREGAMLDMAKIAAAAKEHRVMLEIDAECLDLPDTYARIAHDHKVMLVLAGKNLRYALDVARRGWWTKKGIANALPEEAIRKMKR
jgi:DNA polymerase (family 10)